MDALDQIVSDKFGYKRLERSFKLVDPLADSGSSSSPHYFNLLAWGNLTKVFAVAGLSKLVIASIEDLFSNSAKLAVSPENVSNSGSDSDFSDSGDEENDFYYYNGSNVFNASNINHLLFSLDEKFLYYTVHSKIYLVNTIQTIQSSSFNPTLLLEIQNDLSTENPLSITDFKINPFNSNYLTFLTSNHSLYFFDLSTKKQSLIHSDVSSFTYNSVYDNDNYKFQQLYIGLKNGSVALSDVSDPSNFLILKTFSNSAAPNHFFPISLIPINNATLLAVYDISSNPNDDNDSDLRYEHYLINTQNNQFSSSYDLCYYSEIPRYGYYYNCNLFNYSKSSNLDNLIFFSSSVSSDIALLSSKKNTYHVDFIRPENDYELATVPFDDENDTDLSTTGFAINLTSTEPSYNISKSIEGESGPLPSLVLLLNNGALIFYDFFNIDAIKSNDYDLKNPLSVLQNHLQFISSKSSKKVDQNISLEDSFSTFKLNQELNNANNNNTSNNNTNNNNNNNININNKDNLVNGNIQNNTIPNNNSTNNSNSNPFAKYTLPNNNHNNQNSTLLFQSDSNPFSTGTKSLVFSHNNGFGNLNNNTKNAFGSSSAFGSPFSTLSNENKTWSSIPNKDLSTAGPTSFNLKSQGPTSFGSNNNTPSFGNSAFGNSTFGNSTFGKSAFGSFGNKPVISSKIPLPIHPASPEKIKINGFASYAQSSKGFLSKDKNSTLNGNTNGSSNNTIFPSSRVNSTMDDIVTNVFNNKKLPISSNNGFNYSSNNQNTRKVENKNEETDSSDFSVSNSEEELEELNKTYIEITKNHSPSYPLLNGTILNQNPENDDENKLNNNKIGISNEVFVNKLKIDSDDTQQKNGISENELEPNSEPLNGKTEINSLNKKEKENDSLKDENKLSVNLKPDDDQKVIIPTQNNISPEPKNILFNGDIKSTDTKPLGFLQTNSFNAPNRIQSFESSDDEYEASNSDSDQNETSENEQSELDYDTVTKSSDQEFRIKKEEDQVIPKFENSVKPLDKQVIKKESDLQDLVASENNSLKLNTGRQLKSVSTKDNFTQTVEPNLIDSSVQTFKNEKDFSVQAFENQENYYGPFFVAKDILPHIEISNVKYPRSFTDNIYMRKLEEIFYDLSAEFKVLEQNCKNIGIFIENNKFAEAAHGVDLFKYEDQWRLKEVTTVNRMIDEKIQTTQPILGKYKKQLNRIEDFKKDIVKIDKRMKVLEGFKCEGENFKDYGLSLNERIIQKKIRDKFFTNERLIKDIETQLIDLKLQNGTGIIKNDTGRTFDLKKIVKLILQISRDIKIKIGEVEELKAQVDSIKSENKKKRINQINNRNNDSEINEIKLRNDFKDNLFKMFQNRDPVKVTSHAIIRRRK
ncbi:FG-nucleoporin NUP159 ASCRUDRAFT_74747 [Ascoidea rubescens DSM 1968]|uniref:Nucleoporin Nup159/Nup146 N-terminal domain-containing protein n=1 Tax=Ascoidea rubescens DSM 1968 TaxID=1344418 RepID=A0A1D2VLD3_9ASCO|nr:hypothetical protein ASCRUDRAFT_74747 [Ascoidea rubescens DSM 1968]ODV62347.1 hypothetical protein ASCRUDRAFT_74747 [Ascoidea rubescens DSM 1968]